MLLHMCDIALMLYIELLRIQFRVAEVFSTFKVRKLSRDV